MLKGITLMTLIIDTPYPRCVDNYDFMYTNICKNIWKIKNKHTHTTTGPGPFLSLFHSFVHKVIIINYPGVGGRYYLGI